MGQTVTRTFDILERILKEFPREDAIAGKKEGKWYTYSTNEYYKKSHHLATGLMALGLKRGDRSGYSYHQPGGVEYCRYGNGNGRNNSCSYLPNAGRR